MCSSVDAVVADFLRHFERLDSTILHIINMQLTHATFMEIVKYTFRIAFCCMEFAFIYTHNNEFEIITSDDKLTKEEGIQIY